MYESGEDYLEAILRLEQENGFVRSVDVAHKLNVSRPSVSRAMGLLEKARRKFSIPSENNIVR